MKPASEKLKRAIVELHLDSNFQLLLGWLISIYMDDLIAATMPMEVNRRDYMSGKAAAIGQLLDFMAEAASNKTDQDKTREAMLKKKIAFI